MISPHGQLRVYVSTRPADFRKGIDGLALAVQEVIGLDPFSGAAFVFRAKRADRIKILIRDRTGMVLVHKRLEDAKFVWAFAIGLERRARQDVLFGQRGVGHGRDHIVTRLSTKESGPVAKPLNLRASFTPGL